VGAAGGLSRGFDLPADGQATGVDGGPLHEEGSLMGRARRGAGAQRHAGHSSRHAHGGPRPALEAVTEAGAGDVAAPGEVRRWLREHLAQAEVSPATVEDAVLLASELVTNVVRHTEQPGRVHLKVLADAVVVEVVDGDAGQPVTKAAGERDTSGRGVALVEAIAKAWGSRPDAFGKAVWFELPR
jgi:hypothetical protein